MAYSFAQLQQAWISAGGPVAISGIAAAIAATESSFGTQLYGDSYPGIGSTSFGPWQIHVEDAQGNPVNTLPNGEPYDTTQLATNLAYNASAAVAVYNAAGQSFTPWTTYNNGSYAGALNAAGVAAPSASSEAPTVTPIPATSPDTATSVTGAASAPAFGTGGPTFVPVNLPPQMTALLAVGAALVLLVSISGRSTHGH